MPGPIQSLRFVHAALEHDLARLKSAIHGELSHESARAVHNDTRFFARVLDGHTRGEEKGLFPRLKHKEPHLADVYLLDHEIERAGFAELVAALERYVAGDDAALTVARERITVLAHHGTLHIQKENTLVLPFVEEAFSPEEQGAIVSDILSVFAPTDLEQVMPWIVNNVPSAMAVGYVELLGRVLPPPAKKAAKGWLEAGVREDRLREITGVLHGLA